MRLITVYSGSRGIGRKTTHISTGPRKTKCGRTITSTEVSYKNGNASSVTCKRCKK